jgi:uncharacterized 2Fe-2S/4Fe-4S cluster protein (DUF4445 family)
MPEAFRVDYQPVGRRGLARPGQTLLAAAQAAGVGLASVCGGAGTCEECRVRLVSGQLSAPTLVEQAALGDEALAAGFRLACQAEPLGDVVLYLPAESLTAAQRLQVEGDEARIQPAPAVTAPGAHGLAVDIGTTKLAAYLVRLESGETVARAGAMNPQIAYGEDVVSRIAFAGSEPDGARRLQTILVGVLNGLLADLCEQARVERKAVLDACAVGNTAMHHLFAGLPVEQLGHAPFSPATTAALSLSAAEIGLALAAEARVYLPPVVAGYVGADHLAMLLATGTWAAARPTIALDIGTNTEISLISGGKATCCSCASGPAFEGAHIHEGMRAASGAIERARWSDGRLLWQSIGGLPPVGICGSGILDVVAALQDGQMLKPSGVLHGSKAEIVLVPAAATGLGRDLVVTRRDVHEVQLAKSAIRAGIETLLHEAGLTFDAIEECVVAGAFGTYLDLRSAVRTGMFPPLPLERFRQVGNAAGAGAKQMLVSLQKRREAEELARGIGYLELTSQPDFAALFMKHLSFES